MKTIAITTLSLLFGASLAFSQCSAVRNFLDVSFLGNETHQVNGTMGLVNSTGIAVRYGKTIGGFSYFLGVTNRNASIMFDEGFFQTGRQTLGFGLKQELVHFGRFSMAPLVSVYGGRMQWSAVGDVGLVDNYRYSSTMLGTEVGLEADYSLLCFLDVFGRSTMAFEKGLKSSDAYPVEYLQARPISEIGLRLSI